MVPFLYQNLIKIFNLITFKYLSQVHNIVLVDFTQYYGLDSFLQYITNSNIIEMD